MENSWILAPGGRARIPEDSRSRLLVKEQPRSNGNPDIRETPAAWGEQQGM